MRRLSGFIYDWTRDPIIGIQVDPQCHQVPTRTNKDKSSTTSQFLTWIRTPYNTTMATSIDDKVPQSTSYSPLIGLEKSFVDVHATSLLLESLSMDSLSTISSESNIPPFPPGCMIPMSTILSVSVKAGEHNATITVPTPPRLRTMLKENLCIKKWAVRSIYPDSPHQLMRFSGKSFF